MIPWVLTPTLTHARWFARAVAWVLAITATISLIGIALDWSVAIQPLSAWPPLTLVGAGGLLVSAMGLESLARDDGRSLRFAALFGLLVAAFGVIALARRGAFPTPFQATLQTAVTLGVVGLTLAIAAFCRRALGQVALGTGGFVLLALGLASVFVRLVGVSSVFGDGSFGSTPVQIAVGAILTGAAFILLVWTGEPLEGAFPDWIPVGVVLAGVVSTGFLWQALSVRESADVRRLVRHALSGEQAALRREVDAIARLLRQASQWSDSEVGVDERSVRLVELLRDIPGLQAIALLDSSGAPAAFVPTTADIGELVLAMRAAPPPSFAEPVRYLPSRGGTNRFVVHAPACRNGRCQGGTAGLVSTDQLFNRTAGERTSGFVFSITAANNRVPPADWQQSVLLDFGAVHWTLSARPSAATLAATRSSLPEIVLILGLALTAILHLTLLLGDSAWRNARTVERLRLSEALDRATDAIWEWDTQTGRMERSAQLWRHLGYDLGGLKQSFTEWTELIHPDDRDEVVRKLLAHAFDGHEGFEAEYRVATSDGEWHILADRGRAVERDLGGRAHRILGITADVTAGRRAEQALREIDALTTMGRVAAKVAHEINNPLAGIQSAFMLIKAAIPKDHPDFHYTGAIEREISRIGAVTRQLYETYRPDPEDGSGTSVGTLVRDATAFISQVNRSAGVNFDVMIDTLPTVLPLSGAVLRQIIYNLVQNAVDASPVGGRIMVVAEVEGRELVMRISDQGPGVSPELRTRIFEPFFSTKGRSRTSGMGLGLAMVSRSVSSAGGSIEVDDAPGGGACFHVRLPLPKKGTLA